MHPPSSDAVQKRIAEAGGVELLDRLLALDARRAEMLSSERSRGRVTELPAGVKSTPPVDAGAAVEWDVVVAGGGLSLLMVPLLAKQGARVAVVEPFVAGRTHREWNASASELEVLVTSGLVTPDELASCIAARYDYGICRFHGGQDHAVRGVLDHAVDAARLLALVRARCEALGVTFFDRHKVACESASPHGVAVWLSSTDGRVQHTSCRVLVDARGASSPYATADLICPTVGGVLAGLREGDGPDEVNRRVGDILVTTEDARLEAVERGGKSAVVHRQYVWEGFPGHPGEVTTYLFYYGLAIETASLVGLYGRFFEELHHYKRGEAHLVRPTFGFIPGWSRQSRAPRSPSRRIVLVGDAASRHSPLTFCGFGAMLRSFERSARHVEVMLQAGASRAKSESESAVHDTELHRWTGGLAYLLATGKLAGDNPNLLLDAAFATLHDMGNDAYAALLRDEMQAADFVLFLRSTSKKRPHVYTDVFSSMGPLRTSQWAWKLLRDYSKT